MCRDIGVTTPAVTATSKSTSACTMTERPATEEVQTMTVGGTGCDGRCIRPASEPTIIAVKPAVVAYTQTDAVIDPITVKVATKADVSTQSVRPATVRTIAVGVMARPRTYDACVTAKPALKNVGCSADLQTDVRKPAVVPVTRTTQTDVSPTPVLHTRATQTTVVPLPVVDRHNSTTQTETVPAAVPKNENGDSASGRLVATAIGRRSNSFHHYTAATATAKEPSTTPQAVTSKIPRRMLVTPELNRKVLVRQDTYTKTAAEIRSEQPPPPLPSDDNEEDVK